MERNSRRWLLRSAAAVSIMAFGFGTRIAYAGCQLAKILELPVSEQHPQPTIPVKACAGAAWADKN